MKEKCDHSNSGPTSTALPRTDPHLKLAHTINWPLEKKGKKKILKEILGKIREVAGEICWVCSEMMSESGPGTNDPDPSLNPLDLAGSACALNHAAAEDDDRSSSTEGPDSPGRSSSSSPVPMMIPSSPYHHHSYHSSSNGPAGSSGLHPEDCSSGGGVSYLLPRYHIKFTEDVTKDADVVRYRIKVRKLTENPEEVIVIERQFEDFEFLHHNLTSKVRE